MKIHRNQSSRPVPGMRQPPGSAETLIVVLDSALRTVFAPPVAVRPMPRAKNPVSQPLGPGEIRRVGELLRVDHVGEVCAQALYSGQAFSCEESELRAHLLAAAAEEGDHLAWTHQRLSELGERRSLLTPIWYAGAFTIGAIAGRAGDAISLGFLVETEKQVEAHLGSHLDELPAADADSRAMLEQMRRDEQAHAAAAQRRGAARLPGFVVRVMRAGARFMTGTARYL